VIPFFCLPERNITCKKPMNDRSSTLVFKLVFEKQKRAILVYIFGLQKDIDVCPVRHDSINIRIHYLRVLGYTFQFVGQVHKWPPYVLQVI
jgi:hypothetical protein